MPDMPFLVPALVLAAGLAGAGMLVVGWPWRAPPPPPFAARGPRVTRVAFLAGALLYVQRFPWRLADDRDRTLAIFMPCAILIETLSPFLARALAWSMRVILAAAGTRIVLHGSVVLQSWTWWQAGLWQAGLGAILLLGWAAVSQEGRPASPRWQLANVALLNAGAGIVVMLSAYITGGPLGLVLAAALVAATLASLVLKDTGGIAAAARIGIAGLFALVVSAHFFASLSVTNAAILLALPLVSWLCELPLANKSRSWLRPMAASILIVLPLAIVAKQAFDKADEPSPAPPTNDAGDYSADDYESLRK
jgi:hypothetical protein